MTGYIGLTLWVVLPLLIAYFLYKVGMPEELVIVFMLIGFLTMIYWVLMTTAIIAYGVKKYIEIGSMDLFIQEFLRSVRD